MHLLDGAVDHRVAGDVLVGAEDIVGGVVGVDVGGDEVDGDVVCLGVGEEGRDPCGLRGGRAADLEARRDGLERAGGVVVELEVGGLLGVAAPEVDVGLVPDFELPGGDFVDAVARDEVLRRRRWIIASQMRVVLRRRDVGLVPEGVQRVGVGGQLLGHEAQLDEGPDVVGEQAVVDLVDVGEVVDGGVVQRACLAGGLGEVDGACGRGRRGRPRP